MSRKPTVLTADDDPAVRLALRTRLTALGYEVLEAADGLGVIAKCRSCNVDALILDHSMPLGAGRDIAVLVRNYTGAPIIFLSGHDRESFRQTVTRIPDTYFLPKPLDAPRLIALLGSLVRPAAPAPAGPSAAQAAAPAMDFAEAP